MKQKTCKACREKFTPARPLQTACSIPCAVSQALKAKDKAKAEREKREKREDKEKRSHLKTHSDHIKEAQIAVNSFVRARDKQRGCISCGTPLSLGGIGGGFDAGHYRSRGAAPHLRFDPRNVHGQCKRCNRYLGGNVAEYRIGLVARIGLQAVLELEADNTPRHWSIDDLKAIAAEHKAKAKELK